MLLYKKLLLMTFGTTYVNEEIPDNGLKGSKHVGLFIKSVLSHLKTSSYVGINKT